MSAEPIEFERRFLTAVSVFEERYTWITANLIAGRIVKVNDLYIEPASQGSPPLRLRIQRELGSDVARCEATIKTGSNSTERPEHTYAISRDAVEEWGRSVPTALQSPIGKLRLGWSENGAKMHVEKISPYRFFGGDIEQRELSARWAIAEAEFPTKAEKDNWIAPDGWIEISGIKAFSNYSLARYGWPSVQDYPFLAGPDPDTGSPQSNTL